MSGANRCWRTGSGDGERFLSTWRRCIETEGNDDREASGVCSEVEESVLLNELLRMREGSSSSSLTTMRLPSPDDSWVVSKLFSSTETTPLFSFLLSSIIMRITLVKFRVVGWGKGDGDPCPSSAVPWCTWSCETIPGAGIQHQWWFRGIGVHKPTSNGRWRWTRPPRSVGVAKVAELDSEAQVSLIGERPTICCYSEYKQTPRNPSTSCGPSSRWSVSMMHARADAHCRLFPPSPHLGPSSASLPPSYHPPPTLAVTANVAWTLLNPSLSGRISPLILTPVWVGLG